MNTDTTIANLEQEWDLERGFLGRLRRGQFDAGCFERLVSILDGIDLQGNVNVNRRLVSLLWYIPLFMEWQTERVREAGGNPIEFVKAISYVQGSIERILGAP